MRKVVNNTPFRLRDSGLARSWSVFISGASGPVVVEVAPTMNGPFVEADSFEEDGVHTTDLSLNYFVRIDPANADEVWVI